MSVVFLTFLFLFEKLNCHIILVDPQARSNDSDLTAGPCGLIQAKPNQPWATYKGGESITVSWQESNHVTHEGAEFRIALSYNDTFSEDSGFDSCILLNHIPSHGFGAPRLLSAVVNLPNVDCLSCAIQVVQYLPKYNKECCIWDESGNSESCPRLVSYTTCANIKIIANKNKTVLDRKSMIRCQEPPNWDFSHAGACNEYKYSVSSRHWISLDGKSANLFHNTGFPQDDIHSNCGSKEASYICKDIKLLRLGPKDDLINSIPFSNGGVMTQGGLIAICLIFFLLVCIGFVSYYKKEKRIVKREIHGHHSLRLSSDRRWRHTFQRTNSVETFTDTIDDYHTRMMDDSAMDSID